MSRTTPSGQHRHMPAVTVLVASLGLADSLNPVTILIAMIAAPLLAAGTCAIGCALVVHGARGLLG
jgi:hypothetical protein